MEPWEDPFKTSALEAATLSRTSEPFSTQPRLAEWHEERI